MLLWIALIIAFFFGLFHPFTTRLQDTSLWLGKALVPSDFASAYPRGLQDPLTSGWPSTYIFVVSLLPFISATIAFFYSWWAAILVYVISIILAAIFSRSNVASKKVERYIAILADHARNRVADYNKKGDYDRATAAEQLTESLTEILVIYLESDVIVPTMSQAKNAPYGDQYYLLDLNS